MLDYIALAILILLVLVIVFAVLKLAALPGKLAESKGHPQADAIRVCGWLGLLTGGVCWIIALVWAYTRLPSAEAGPPLSEEPLEDSTDSPEESEGEEAENEKEAAA